MPASGGEGGRREDESPSFVRWGKLSIACGCCFLAQLFATAHLSFVRGTVAAFTSPTHRKCNARKEDRPDDAIFGTRRKRRRERNTSFLTSGADFGENRIAEGDAAPGKDRPFDQFAVVNDLVGVSERLLKNLDTTSSAFASSRNNKSYSSPLSRLSKANHNLMAKSSNMRRQRFVTGRYPLYVSVKQNPTKKWLVRLSLRTTGV